jgi:fatty-acyl-CoA synthase
MAALVVGPDFDLTRLAARLDAELPPYARPLFLRIQPAIETTGTFKYRKADLAEQGFDPARVTDPLFFRYLQAGYVELDPVLHARVTSGQLRF